MLFYSKAVQYTNLSNPTKYTHNNWNLGIIYNNSTK